MTEEKKAALKKDVAAAMAAITGRGEYPSTPRIRAEIKMMTGHPGNQNEVDECRREIVEEQKSAAGKTATQPGPAEPLPEVVASVFSSTAATLSDGLNALASTLASVLTEAKAEYHRVADAQVVDIKADAVRRIEEAELEVRDYALDVERCEREIAELQKVVARQSAELTAAKEALAMEQGRSGQLQAECSAAKAEAAGERTKAGIAKDESAAANAEAAGLKAERDAATRVSERLSYELEQVTAKNGELSAELQSARLAKADLEGQNRQLSAELARFRDEMKAERERADKASEDARTAKAEATRLAESLKAMGGKKGSGNV